MGWVAFYNKVAPDDQGGNVGAQSRHLVRRGLANLRGRMQQAHRHKVTLTTDEVVNGKMFQQGRHRIATA